MIKICHISTVHSLYDDRIFYKECVSLAKAGFEVNLAIAHSKKTSLSGVQILPLKKHKNRLKRFIFGSWNAFWVALKSGAKICHFHDPELMFTGILLRIFGRKVIYDVHEDLPKQVLYKPWINSPTVRKITSKLIYIAEQFSCLFFNGIVTVTDDIFRKYKPKKTIIIRNLPLLSMGKNIKKKIVRPAEKTIFIYAGGLSPVRGIKEVITAFEAVKKQSELWLLGDWESIEYKNACLNSSNESYIKYLGYKKMEEVYEYIAVADVGIAMLYPIKNFVTSLPVKAFEYMRFAKPILMSDFEYWKEIFAGAAIFSDPKNTAQIAEKLNDLAGNKQEREKLGKQGLQKIESELSWEKEAEILIDFYKKMYDHS